MAVKTRSELIAQNTATFGNGKNTRGDDEKAFNLNHLDSFLNKKGDALENNGYVAVVDGSKLKQGTNGGIAFECAVGYDFQWKEGVAYYRPTGGSIVAAVSAVNQVPNTGFDSTIFYAVGSRFFNLVTNVQYICTDATPTSAAWSVVPAGSGTPGGSTTELQYNNGGAFGGITGATTNGTFVTLTTPVLGVATATSINKVAITAPATSATLTLADGSTLATSGAFSTTLTATAATTLTLPTTGTLATLSGTETFANKTLNGPKIGTASGSGHFHMHYANSVPTGLADYITVFGDTSPKKLGFLFELDAFESYFQFEATATSKTYTFPDLSGTVTLNPMTTLGDIIYGGTVVGGIAPPTRLGIGTVNQVLAVSAGLIPEWKTIAAGGNVTGPSSSVDGNFAVFDSTTGKIIKESAGASLSAAGAAVFNTSVSVGESSKTTGTIAFRNSANSGRTIVQGSTSQGAVDINYYWPTAQGTAGQILANDGSGNLSWTAAGAGNMVLASTQTNTGAKTFNSGTFILAGATSGTTIFNAAATASGTITLPNLTGTVALLENAQTFTGAKTFRAAVTIGDATYTAANLAMGGTVSNLISFGTAGNGVPTNTVTPSVGSKIVLFPSGAAGTSTDFAIGFSATNTETWLSTSGGSNSKVSFYGGVTRLGFWGASGGVGGLYVGDGSTVGLLQMNSTTSNLILFGTGGVAAPTFTTRSAGTKMVVLNTLSGPAVDYAIGYNTGSFWFSIPDGPATFFSWYNNTTECLRFAGRSGIMSFLTVGSGFSIKDATASGSANCRMGLATLVAGAATITNSLVTASTRILLTVQTAGGTQGNLRITRTAGTSFTITSTSALETSTVAWLFVEPIA